MKYWKNTAGACILFLAASRSPTTSSACNYNSKVSIRKLGFMHLPSQEDNNNNSVNKSISNVSQS